MDISAENMRNRLSDTLNRVAYRGERVVITRRHKPVAAMVSVEDLALLETIEDHVDIEDAKRAVAEMKSGAKAIPWAKLRRELGI